VNQDRHIASLLRELAEAFERRGDAEKNRQRPTRRRRRQRAAPPPTTTPSDEALAATREALRRQGAA